MNVTVDHLHHVEHVMGMAISIDIRQPLPDAGALDDVIAWLHHVDDTFSTYKHDSEISRFGRGELSITDLSTETEDVLLRCLELTEITDGTFDAFAVPAPNGTTPRPIRLRQGMGNRERRRTSSKPPEPTTCASTPAATSPSAAHPTTDHGWRVGIRHPDQPLQQATVITMTGTIAIATSATYERGAHIIDPRTGEPTTDLASATVIGPDLGTADAYATALFVMGVDGLELDRKPARLRRLHHHPRQHHPLDHRIPARNPDPVLTLWTRPNRTLPAHPQLSPLLDQPAQRADPP